MEKLLKSIKDMEGKTVEAAIQCQTCSSVDDEPTLIRFTDGTVIKLGVKYGDEVCAEDSLGDCCQVACGLMSQAEYDERVGERRKAQRQRRDEQERRAYEALRAKFEK